MYALSYLYTKDSLAATGFEHFHGSSSICRTIGVERAKNRTAYHHFGATSLIRKGQSNQSDVLVDHLGIEKEDRAYCPTSDSCEDLHLPPR